MRSIPTTSRPVPVPAPLLPSVRADLQAQLHAIHVAAACAADLERIADLHGGSCRGPPIQQKHGRAREPMAAADAGGGDHLGQGGGGGVGGAGCGRRKLPLDSGLLDRGLLRRRLHDPMQEMQARAYGGRARSVLAIHAEWGACVFACGRASMHICMCCKGKRDWAYSVG